jgi:multiple sugar transport system substrate-binding protein
VSLAFADHHTAMTTALATGTNLPDVMAVEIGYIGKFAESGGLEDLGAAPYNGLQYQKQFARFTYPQAMSGMGKLAAVPADIGPGTLFYRKDILDKAGVTEAALTQSWESHIEAGKKVKAATGAYLLASAVDIKDIYIRSSLKDGEGIYFDKAGKVLVDSPRFVKGFELARAARQAGIDAKITAWSNEWGEGFKRGQIATQMMGAWLGGHLAAGRRLGLVGRVVLRHPQEGSQQAARLGIHQVHGARQGPATACLPWAGCVPGADHGTG